MEFGSLIFVFIYLPIFLLSVNLINNNTLKNILILIFSALFYVINDLENFLLIVLIALATYLVALKVKSNKKIYIAYMTLIVLLLSYFKYGVKVLEGLSLFKTSGNTLAIIMPLGISFIVFTAIGYVSDCYYGKIEADRNLLNVCTFIFFFPTVVSGPILRYDDFHGFLKEKNTANTGIWSGIRQFVYGLAKKTIFANQLAVITDVVFVNNADLSFLVSWYATLSYMMQIYFDFSGYSDMAIGIGKMIGFDMKDNFNYPYISNSPQEFWRRWHISLGSWFRDYVYIPLGGNRCSATRNIINTMIVWVLTGIWHGSTLNYVAWGIYNGIILIVYKFIFKKERKSLLSWLFNMVYVFGGWLIFKCSNLSQFKSIIKGLIGLGKNTSFMYIKSLDILYLLPVFVLGFICCFPFVKKLLDKTDEKSSLVSRLITLLIFSVCIGLILSGSYSSFIYFNF